MAEQIERRISFNGGEVSVWTDPRVDLDKYRSSCRQMVNFQPTIYGGAYRRSGSNYLSPAVDESAPVRLECFEFSFNSGSSRQSICMEFGDGYVAFYFVAGAISINAPLWFSGHAYKVDDYIVPTFGGLLYRATVNHTSGATFAGDLAAGKWVLSPRYRLTTPYTSDEVFELQFVQQNDVIFIAHPNHQPKIISRIEQTEFAITDFEQEWPSVRDENTTETTITPSGVTGSVTLTASDPIFSSGHVGSRWLIVRRREDPSVELRLDTGAEGDTSDPLFVLGEWSCNIRADNSGFGTFDIKIIVERSYDKVTWETVRTLGSEKASIQTQITGTEIDPAFLRIRYFSKDGTVPARMSAVLEAIDPDHYGIVEITSYSSQTSVTAQVLFELGGTTATAKWNEAAWSNYRGWPRAICLHEQRLYFGGSNGQPQTIWGSVIDDYTNFRIGTDDDTGLSLTIAADQSFGIVWMLSQSNLLVGTGGSEWVITGADRDANITPTTAKAKRASAFGSASIAALAAQEATLFVSRSKQQVYEMAYSLDRDNQASTPLTLLSEHITGTGIKQVDIQKNPSSIFWACTTDGRIIGLAYERSQNVAGWFQVTCGSTGDIFESVCVGNNTVFCSVRRLVNGVYRRYVEYFQPGQLDALRLYTTGPVPDSLVFTDCSLRLQSFADPQTVWTGLDHLEGREVSVLADGVVRNNVTVTGGQITLSEVATKITVGLPYVSTLQPTWMEGNDPATLEKPAKKAVRRVLFELYRSLGGTVSSGSQGDRIDYRNTNPLGAPSLFTGEIEQAVAPSTDRQASVIIQQSQPLPLVILSLHVRMDVNLS